MARAAVPLPRRCAQVHCAPSGDVCGGRLHTAACRCRLACPRCREGAREFATRRQTAWTAGVHGGHSGVATCEHCKKPPPRGHHRRSHARKSATRGWARWFRGRANYSIWTYLNALAAPSRFIPGLGAATALLQHSDIAPSAWWACPASSVAAQ